MVTDDVLLVAETRRMVRDGRALRVRREAGLSQTEVGQVVGVTAAAVSRWERGERLPRTDTALRYARLLSALTKATQDA